MAALRIALTDAPKAPFIFVTGSLPMEMQNDLVANGAVACIDKNQLCLLGDAVREALGSSTSV